MKIKLLLVLLLSTLISTAQFTEGFESAIPATWTVINNGGANGWIQESGPNGGAQEGTAVASIEYNSSSHDDYLITPSINVVSNVNDRMSFYVKSRSSTFLESYEVLLSTTGVTDTDFTVVLQSSQIASNSWTQLEFNLSPYIGQTVYVALRATGTDEFQLFADNFVNDGNPTCVEPSILNAASITAISANLGWTAAGSETLWDVEYGADGFTQGTGTTVAANSNPYTLNTLTESTDYDYYVRANCGGGDVSAWAGPFSFSTPASCLIPTALDAANITSSSAELSWASGGSGESSWEIEYGIDGFTQGAGTTITPATNPVSTTGLMSNTDYDYYVRANCGAGDFSEWVGPFSFTTLCAAEIPDFLEDFSSYIPSCWVEAVDGDPVNGPSSLGSSKWAEEEFAHLSSSGNGGVNINIYQTDDIEWLLSPQFDLSAGGYEINLDVAFTNYNATTQGVFDTDDDVRLLYTLDGVTWTTVVQWNAANGNTPAAGGETFNADLSAITGSNVQFAIYSDEGATASGDKDFHIDNFQVRTIPSCQEPTVLTASNITATSAYLGWTVSGSAETMWDVEYGVAGFTQGGVASTIIDNTSNNPYNASGLTESADYDFYVRAHCGVGNESAWAGPFSFSTPASCLIPTALSAANITATSADLSWTSGGSGEASWEVEYGVDGFTQGAGNVITPATNPYNLNVLTSNTAYDYYVRANCGGGDFSEWVGPYSFTTPCVAFNIPFTENFDSSTTGSSSNTNAPDCWSFIDSGSGYVYIYDNSATNVQSGDKSYRFYNGFDSSGDYMLISPEIAELTTDGVQVQFSAKGTSSGQELELGTITDPNDASTFTVLVTATLTSSSFENIEINIPTSTDSYFAVRHGQTSTLDSYYLDDFSFNALPSCVPPTALSAANITATSVDLSWTSGGSGEASWEIEHGTDGFTQGAGTIVTPATNPYNLTGLTANTTYDYYVRANCRAGDYSEWVGPYSFETSCESKVPGYVENFDSYVPDCWEEATGELDASLNIGSSSWASDGFANNGTTGAARYNMYTTTTGQWLISPPIDLGIGNSNQLKFDISATDYASSTFAASFGVDDIVNVVISTDNGATWSTSNVLQTWTQGTTPSVAGDAISIDLSAYSGLVKVGFVAKASSSIASDWDLFIDNFEVNAGSQDYIWNGTSWNNTPEGNITSNDNMIIQSGSMPSLTGAISVNDLTIEAGASLEADNGNITVSGDLVNNGAISGSNEVVFIGAAEVITGTGTMNNLTVGSTGAIVVAGQQSILEQLDVISGGSLSVDASGDLTLVSNAMGTARVDAVDAGSITGNVNVERYIPAGNRAFRFLGSTVSGASVFDSWQEAGNNSAGFGVQVTGTAGTVGTVNVNGHDETATGNQSLFKWDNSLQSWSGVANTKTEILNAGDFYRVFVRGDRMNDLSASNPSSTATTLRATGTLMTGPMTVTPGTSMGEFFALSNPYQSKLSMSVATTAGVAADMYYWDPNVGPRGTYSTISISGGVGTIGNATNVLEPGQAVFFADSGTGASITLEESDKVGGNNNVNVFRATPLQQALRLKIYQTSRFNSNQTASDGLYIDFDTAHNLNLDLNDAVKLNGLNVNMAIAKSTGELLSVERRTLPDANEVVGLNVINYLTTAYTFNATLDILPSVTVYLKDNFTGTMTEMIQGTSTSVDFTVDLNNSQSVDAARFEIVFQRSTLGNDDHLFTNSVNVYPNPVNDDVINISLGTITEEKVQVTLFNTLGQQVISQDFNSNSNDIIRLNNLSSLESGLYILNISNGIEIVTKKIILE